LEFCANISNMSSHITSQETHARRFSAASVTVFTLTEGCLVGKAKSGGGWQPYAVRVLDVSLAHIAQANAQELDRLARAIEERRGALR
jgi:hypothetical protein